MQLRNRARGALPIHVRDQSTALQRSRRQGAQRHISQPNAQAGKTDAK
jgi:hypothetical protein